MTTRECDGSSVRLVKSSLSIWVPLYTCVQFVRIHGGVYLGSVQIFCIYDILQKKVQKGNEWVSWQIEKDDRIGALLPNVWPCPMRLRTKRTWRGCQGHHAVVWEGARFKLHTFFPSFHFHFPLWREKAGIFSPVARAYWHTLYNIWSFLRFLSNFLSQHYWGSKASAHLSHWEEVSHSF